MGFEAAMHLHWESEVPNTAGVCHIKSLSWMGRVPDEIPQVSFNAPPERITLSSFNLSVWKFIVESLILV